MTPAPTTERNQPPWYAAGLRFECTNCGNCCTGAPGYVTFTTAEAKAMASALAITEDAFHEHYTRDTPAGRSLTETETQFGHDCVFLDRQTQPGKALCRVYKARPAQCRTLPFWKSNLKTQNHWKRAKQTCPGMDQGPLHDLDHIELTVSIDTEAARNA